MKLLCLVFFAENPRLMKEVGKSEGHESEHILGPKRPPSVMERGSRTVEKNGTGRD
jgi:hypothetical protein